MFLLTIIVFLLSYVPSHDGNGSVIVAGHTCWIPTGEGLGFGDGTAAGAAAREVNLCRTRQGCSEEGAARMCL